MVVEEELVPFLQVGLAEVHVWVVPVGLGQEGVQVQLPHQWHLEEEEALHSVQSS